MKQISCLPCYSSVFWFPSWKSIACPKKNHQQERVGKNIWRNNFSKRWTCSARRGFNFRIVVSLDQYAYRLPSPLPSKASKILSPWNFGHVFELLSIIFQLQYNNNISIINNILFLFHWVRRINSIKSMEASVISPLFHTKTNLSNWETFLQKLLVHSHTKNISYALSNFNLHSYVS